MATRQEIEAYIRAAARARGLDPDFAVAVAKGESGLNPNARLTTPREDSKGIWQLNTKNGLGVEALKRGIDPGDPSQWQRQTDFALDEARKSWRPWTVARNLQAGRATPAGHSANLQPPAATSGQTEYPNSPLTSPGALAASVVDPFRKLADERKERQAQQALEEARALAHQPPAPAPAPAPVAPPLPPVDYATLLMPRLRRGLLANQGYGLLGDA